MGNSVIPGYLPTFELHWLVPLLFTPDEVPLLLAQPGKTMPVIHYWRPTGQN